MRQFDVVILKMSFYTKPNDALRFVQTIRAAFNGKRLIYFDGDDDLCVQWPEILPYVDIYVKKHLFRDRKQYLKRYVGKTNLTDYVHRQYGYSFTSDPVAAETRPLLPEQLKKVTVGFNLASDRNIVELYKRRQLCTVEHTRPYDVVFRGSVPKGWMFYLRKDIGPALERLAKRYRVITPVNRVPVDEYYREMCGSRICVSPFGYGEICWRDFEAILCGCLLIKPDMSSC